MSFLEKAWSKRASWLLLLWPLSLFFQFVAAQRKRSLISKQIPAPTTPVIVIGNISVGGTGKTPFLIALCKYLQEKGSKPGIISRGYGGQAKEYPFVVSADSSFTEAGDEPLLIAQRTGCPVITDPDRVSALSHLLENFNVDVVLSDDGLQHYALPRHIEICLVDGQQLLGNGLCLPAGFLREPPSRLREVDLVILNYLSIQTMEDESELHDLNDEVGSESLFEKSQLTNSEVLVNSTGVRIANIHSTKVTPGFLVNLSSGEKRPFLGAPFNMGTQVHCVTGIGNPDRFIKLLDQLSYPITPHIFPDHHPFTPQDFESLPTESNQPIVMTEKDGIKCREFAAANFWYLEINLEMDPKLLAAIDARLQQIIGD